jgi:hypothetical protein
MNEKIKEVTLPDIEKILTVTEGLGLSREALVIALAGRKQG